LRSPTRPVKAARPCVPIGKKRPAAGAPHAAEPVEPLRGKAGRAAARQIRAALNSRFTQQELALLADVHVRTVRGLESGAVARPRRETVGAGSGAPRDLSQPPRLHFRIGLAPGADAALVQATWPKLPTIQPDTQRVKR
jgi:hypothetical protein